MIQIDHKKFLRMKITPISDDYELFNEIGKGGFGSVFKAKDRKTNEVRAIKKINKSSLTPEEKSSLVNEFDILSSLDHPNIIKLYDIYDDQNDLYVVTELCEGGDLLRFVNSRKITEKIMRTVMVQLISAVKYMHNFKILHRDIKLENIVLVKNITHEKQKIEIKLIDFGISLNLDKVKPSTEFDPIGTLLYMSPESINGHASLSADIWSCGIALYMMCTRKLPFNFKNDTELVHRIKKGQIVRNRNFGVT
jgi:calcium-dependent protein kinase